MAVGAASVALSAPRLTEPFIGGPHSFREAQTAFPALLYARDGIDLLRPPVPVFGPPWTLPFEFPLFQAIASIPIGAGVPLEVAVRSLAFVSYLTCSILIWLIAGRHQASQPTSLALFALSPLAMRWSTAGLIEYFALSFALGFVYFIDRGRYSVGCVLGAAAMVVKATTGAVWVIAFAMLAPRPWRPVLVGIPMAAGLAWLGYSNAVRAASPTTEFLAGEWLSTWTFGLADRLDPSTWLVIGAGVFVHTGGLVLIPALGFVRRRWEVALVASLAIPPLVLTNLYLRHEYYFVAISAAAALLVGRAWTVGSPQARFAGTALAAIGIVMAYVYPTDDHWDSRYVTGAAAAIRSATSPDEIVRVVGRDWHPGVLLYAQRRGLMVPDLMRDDGRYASRPGYVDVICSETCEVFR